MIAVQWEISLEAFKGLKRLNTYNVPAYTNPNGANFGSEVEFDVE